MPSLLESKTQRLNGAPPFPLVSRVDALRERCKIGIGLFSEILGVTRLTYYLWLTGKTGIPKRWRQEQMLIVGKAMLIGLKHEHLPVPRSKLLTHAEWRTKVRDTVTQLMVAAK